jgi:hypothetical protein
MFATIPYLCSQIVLSVVHLKKMFLHCIRTILGHFHRLDSGQSLVRVILSRLRRNYGVQLSIRQLFQLLPCASPTNAGRNVARC